MKDLLPGNFNKSLWWRGRDWQEGTCPTAGRSPGLQGTWAGERGPVQVGDGELAATLGCTLMLFQPRVHWFTVSASSLKQSAKQPQPLFWNGVFQGFEGFWSGVFLGNIFFKSLMLIAGITSFTSFLLPLKQTNKEFFGGISWEHCHIDCRKVKQMNDQKGSKSSQKWQSGMG